MPAFIAYWPDSSISVLSYPGGSDDSTYESWLFEDLDQERDPLEAKVYKLPQGYHLQTEVWIGKNKKTGKHRACLSVTGFHCDDKRPKRMAWSPDISFRRWNRIRMQQRKAAAEKAAESSIASYCSDDSSYPPVPAACFTIEEVRAMQPFSGIYIAIHEHTGAVQYVGKSRDVTKRVSSSRKELADCRIAVVRMAPEDIHFAELHYIAKCRPYANRCGQSCPDDR